MLLALEALSILLLFNLIFVGVLALALTPVSKYNHAAWAVLKRNFISYFSNPTGYVFLCLFVLLTSFAAFWPHDFFNTNLATLDQLNKYLPPLMLIFIPAITMSIWAEERRQGTDELLLTLPADDFDIVLGKYLAAAAIFTCSLIFSQFSNYGILVLLSEGNVDTGLFFTTYLGYWFTGLAMLAVGMVASFFTHNLTVGFILGVVFNAPLVFAYYADVIIPWGGAARVVAQWSTAARFDDFGRGVVSLSSVAYFLMVVVGGFYLSMVLIGKRHWLGGKDGDSMIGHYLARTLSLIVLTLAATYFFSNHDFFRWDATRGKISSLSPETIKMVKRLEAKNPIQIDAFLSSQVPEAYVKTKYELVSLLKEFQKLSGNKMIVRIYDNLEPSSPEMTLAEESFGIRPQDVRTRSRGKIQDDQVILSAAFTCGLQKVVVPFFDYGVGVEYELVRSIGTVVKGERKKLGVINTDARVMGGFDMSMGFRQMPQMEFISELQKQYDVEEVNPSEEITLGKFDVLLAVQPSSLGPPELKNLVKAIEAGQPTAIFEDPLPMAMRHVPGTGDPKQRPGGMMGMGGGPMPKGNIKELWDVIGLKIDTELGAGAFHGGGMGGPSPNIAWQDYNPYPRLREVQQFTPAWLFIRNDAPEADNALSKDDPITRGLDEVLLIGAGIVDQSSEAKDKFTFSKLVSTIPSAGTITHARFMEVARESRDPSALRYLQVASSGPLAVAARIRGKAEKEKDEKKEGDKKDDAKKPIHVVYVTDIDMLIDDFARLRARPQDAEDMQFQFENVTFVLNIIDSLSGDDAYVEVRKRKFRHSTLKMVEARTQKLRDADRAAQEKFEEDFKDEEKKARKEMEEAIEKFQKEFDELQKQQREGTADYGKLIAAKQTMDEKRELLNRRLNVKLEQLKRERDAKRAISQRKTDLEIRSIQNTYKMWAVVLPPIPPLLIGLVVFVGRRMREREGIAKSRLR